MESNKLRQKIWQKMNRNVVEHSQTRQSRQERPEEVLTID